MGNKRCDLTLFQLGCACLLQAGLLDHLLNKGNHIPVAFQLTG